MSTVTTIVVTLISCVVGMLLWIRQTRNVPNEHKH